MSRSQGDAPSATTSFCPVPHKLRDQVWLAVGTAVGAAAWALLSDRLVSHNVGSPDLVSAKEDETHGGNTVSVQREAMRSSYWQQDLNYGDLIKSIVLAQKPTVVVEYGILDGFSLKLFNRWSPPSCKISAYDIFDKFNGNAAKRDQLDATFSGEKKITIGEQDFYDAPDHLEDGSIDILHIDIANNGDVYEFAVTKLMQKLKPTGILLLEGGTSERDAVGWMKKYNKRLIRPYLDALIKKGEYVVTTFGKSPGLTLIQR